MKARLLMIALVLLMINPTAVLAQQEESLGDFSLLPAAIAATGLSILILDEEVQRFSQRNQMGIEGKGTFIQHGFSAMLPVFAIAGYIGGNEKAQLTSRALLRAIVATILVTSGLKEVFGRTRPNSWEGAHEFSPFSGNKALPSGHTSHSFTIATVLSEIYGEEYAWVPYIAYGAAGFVAYSRIDGNEHWLSDIILGAAIGHVLGKWAVSKETRTITPIVLNNGGVGLQAKFSF